MPATDDEPLPREIEFLFQEHYPLVYRTAYGVTGRVEDAEDVVQTVFLRLLNGDRTRGLENPRAYLYRAAVNVSLTVVQARRRRERAQADEECAAVLPVRVTTHAEDVHRRLYEAIARLRPKTASIVILRYLHGYSDRDIAKMLGTSRSVIAVTLFRARVRLKSLLGESLGED